LAQDLSDFETTFSDAELGDNNPQTVGPDCISEESQFAYAIVKQAAIEDDVDHSYDEQDLAAIIEVNVITKWTPTKRIKKKQL
jgi:hypothetical protein